MSLSKSKIIHIIVEAVLIIALGSYCIINLNKLKNRVSNLEQELEAQRTRNNVLEAVVQEIIKVQNPDLKKRVNMIVSNTRQPPQTRQPSPPQTRQHQPPPPPQPPQENPFNSIMSMMAPMMSTMIVGDNDSVASIEEISDNISDADIDIELNELEVVETNNESQVLETNNESQVVETNNESQVVETNIRLDLSKK